MSEPIFFLHFRPNCFWDRIFMGAATLLDFATVIQGGSGRWTWIGTQAQAGKVTETKCLSWLESGVPNHLHCPDPPRLAVVSLAQLETNSGSTIDGHSLFQIWFTAKWWTLWFTSTHMFHGNMLVIHDVLRQPLRNLHNCSLSDLLSHVIITQNVHNQTHMKKHQVTAYM